MRREFGGDLERLAWLGGVGERARKAGRKGEEEENLGRHDKQLGKERHGPLSTVGIC